MYTFFFAAMLQVSDRIHPHFIKHTPTTHKSNYDLDIAHLLSKMIGNLQVTFEIKKKIYSISYAYCYSYNPTKIIFQAQICER